MTGSTGAWRCTVCGYIHRGPEPPEICPVCGASKEVFEAHKDEIRTAPIATHTFKCVICNYVHAGKEPPEVCPVCGALSDQFTPMTHEQRESRAHDTPTGIIIVGGGIAGVAAAESIRESSPSAKITIVSKEQELPYYRLNLTRLLAGEVSPDKLPLHTEQWYSERNIDLRQESSVQSIDLAQGKITLWGGESLPFDKLVLAAGAHPFIPPIAGSHREGVVSLRTLMDAQRLIESAQKGTPTLVLGGGLLGLEAAAALQRQGATVRVVEGFPWLLPRQLDTRGGEILAAHISGLGIELSLGVTVKEVVGDECVRGMAFDDGTIVDGDLLLVSTGVRPNSYLARQAGLEVRQGVVVDNKLRASDPRVFAAGDVAEHQGVVYGTWGPAQFMGSIAGMNAAGDVAEFGGIPLSNTIKVLGIDLFSIGVIKPTDASFREIVQETDQGHYYRFLFRDSALVGAILLGNTSHTSTVTRLIESRADLSKLLQKYPSGADVVEALAEL